MTMKEKAKDILVEEVMSRNPRSASSNITAQAAAKLMKQEDVGSLIIIEDDAAVGMVTEKDLVQKVVAEGRSPSKVRVADIMSSPLVTVGPTESVSDAAKMMANMKLRRLPVIKDQRLVGVLTENDLLRLSPALIELTREWSKLGAGGASLPKNLVTEGYCDNCGAYTDRLMELNGELVCLGCIDQIDSHDNGE
jgi:signal-transduction protein with cAMP-binding, CBS, and nucleotidyltransferase domain